MHDNTWEFHPLLMDNEHMTMESIVSSAISLYSFETTPFTNKALTTPASNQSRALTGVCGFGVRIRGLRCLTTTPFREFFLNKAKQPSLTSLGWCIAYMCNMAFFIHTAADLLPVSVDTAAGNFYSRREVCNCQTATVLAKQYILFLERTNLTSPPFAGMLTHNAKSLIQDKRANWQQQWDMNGHVCGGNTHWS